MIKHSSRFETPLQEIELDSIRSFDRVLDIGAGGEGLVARIGNERVYGVDIRIEEIKEARSKKTTANWIVCDARNLCFKNEAFNLVTIWFSLMYVTRAEDKIQVLSECKRVLAKSGTLHLLDAQINTRKDLFVINIRFKLPDGQVVETGYGVSGSQQQSLGLLKKEIANLGFKMVKENQQEHWFNLVCRK